MEEKIERGHLAATADQLMAAGGLHLATEATTVEEAADDVWELEELQNALMSALTQAARAFGMWAHFDPNAAYFHLRTLGASEHPNDVRTAAIFAVAAMSNGSFDAAMVQNTNVGRWAMEVLAEDFPEWQTILGEGGCNE